MKRNDIKWLLVSFILLLVGGILYLKFRGHTLLMFSWLRYIKAEELFVQINIDKSNILLNFFIYSFPTGVWLLSAIIIFGVIWSEDKRNFIVYTSIFVGINITSEVLQLLRLLPGTFDWIDLLTIVFFSIASIAIFFNET